MAETVGVTPRDEEETQTNGSDEDPFPNCDALMASLGCSASPSLASLNEDKGSSAVPERLSVLSSKAMAQAKALAGPEIVSGGQAQRTASGLAEHHPTAGNASLGGSSYPAAVGNLQPVNIASPRSKSPCCDGDLSSEVPQVPRVPRGAGEPPQAVTALPRTHPGGCHVQQAGSGAKGDTAPCILGQVIWTKTTKVMETLENQKKEEKEKYRLQLAMYRRLLLLRSIRSLHKQLEQQQARLQECYGTVINTKKEVLKHIRSTSPSPSP
ncbi:reticulon-4 receptor-like [Gavia stellata]|uniref:reticulon-4 receptor-like n=1 Tax=Gavia stellata TaxID=37040 RepID=UPI00289FE094|nr:reticulon-4 receptor-like [Gavia stellata]